MTQASLGFSDESLQRGIATLKERGISQEALDSKKILSAMTIGLIKPWHSTTTSLYLRQ